MDDNDDDETPSINTLLTPRVLEGLRVIEAHFAEEERRAALGENESKPWTTTRQAPVGKLAEGR